MMETGSTRRLRCQILSRVNTNRCASSSATPVSPCRLRLRNRLKTKADNEVGARGAVHVLPPQSDVR